MSTPGAVDGGCLCGSVRYRVPTPFDGEIAHCHCTMCRRASGALVVTWFTIDRSAFSVTKGSLSTYASSDHGTRGFCGQCGAQITFATDRHPSEIDVTLASLDNPEDFPPTVHIWTKSRISWLHLDEHLADREN